jgi:hypothetical protein
MEDMLDVYDLREELTSRGLDTSVCHSGGGCQTLYVKSGGKMVGVGPFVDEDGTAAHFETLYYGDESDEDSNGEGEPYVGAWNVVAVADAVEGALTVKA